MPSMANIVVADAAATNRTYTAATPSAGDKSPAVWTRNDPSPYLNRRPRLEVMTRVSGGKLPARIMSYNFTYPVVETIGGVDVVTAQLVGSGTVTLPTNCDATKVNDAYVQLSNLLASALVRSVVSDGYAPT